MLAYFPYQSLSLVNTGRECAFPFKRPPPFPTRWEAEHIPGTAREREKNHQRPVSSPPNRNCAWFVANVGDVKKKKRERGRGGGGGKTLKGVAMEIERFPGCFLWQVLSGVKVLKQNPACTPKVKELSSLLIIKREKSKWIACALKSLPLLIMDSQLSKTVRTIV